MAENNAGYKISLEQDVLDFNSEKKPTVNNFTPGDIRIDGVYSGGLQTKIKLENASVEMNNIPMDHETLCKLEQKDPRVDCIDIKSDVEKYNGIVKTECKDANVKTEFVEQVEIIKEEPKVSEKNEFLHLEMKPESSVKTESDTEDIEFENEEEFLSGDEFLSDNEGRDTTGLSSSEDEEDTTASSLNENLKELAQFDNPKLGDIIDIYRQYHELWDSNNLANLHNDKKQRLMQAMCTDISKKLDATLTCLELDIILKILHKTYVSEKKRKLKCELKQQEFTSSHDNFYRCDFLDDHVGPFRCPHCSIIIKQYRQFQKHKTQHETNQCDICGKVFKKKKSLKCHNLFKHKLRLKVCELCDLSFFDATSLKNHRHLKHKGKCETCGKIFASKQNMQQHFSHIHAVRDEKSLLCQVCGKIFRNYQALYSHKGIHSIENLECPICKKMFQNKRRVNRHIQYMHEGKKFYGKLNRMRRVSKTSEGFENDLKSV